MSEEKTYQPKWEKHVEYQRNKHHHHHHHDGGYNRSMESDKYTNTYGGALKMKDKSAYYGLTSWLQSLCPFYSSHCPMARRFPTLYFMTI